MGADSELYQQVWPEVPIFVAPPLLIRSLYTLWSIMAMTPEVGPFDIPNSGKKHELGVRETRIRIKASIIC